jgi:hypothetical protein
MSNTGNSIKDEAIREIAAGSITSSYQVLGGVYTRDSFRLWLTNNTNGDIYLSTDGVTDMKKLPAMTGRAMDDKTNDMYRKHGTQWYIRYATTPGSPAGWFGAEVEYV